MVKIVLNNLTSKIIGHIPDEVHTQLDKALSYVVKEARFSPKFKANHWDGIIHLYKQHYGQSFHSGLLSFVTETLEDNNIPFQKVDERIVPAQNLPHLVFTPPDNYDEREYQQFTIKQALQRSRGILKLATGAGKTMIVAEMIGSLKTGPFMFYVLTKDLLRQAHDTLSKTLNEPIGIIGDGQCDIQNINVCTIQTAIQAINKGNKIKVSDYRFDAEDTWDEKDLLSLEKTQKLRNLLFSLKGLYMDECVTGDSIVNTEKGKIRIDKIKEEKCRYVLTHDGNNVIYKLIKNFWYKGEKEVLEITLKNGAILKCTKTHIVLTEEGWKQAKDIKKTNKVLYVNADVELSSRQKQMDKLENLFWDIKLQNDHLKNGNNNSNFMLRRLRFANVDVDYLLNLRSLHYVLSSTLEEQKDIPNTFMDTTSSLTTMNIILNLLKMKNKRYSEPAWETLLCRCPINGQQTTDLVQPMEPVKVNGYDTNPTIYANSELKQEKLLIKGLEVNPSLLDQDVYPILQNSQMNFTKTELSSLLLQFWTILEKLDWHGGSVTMDQTVLGVYRYILKDGIKELIQSYNNGFLTMDLIAQYNNILKKIKNIIILDSEPKAVKNYQHLLENTFQNVCNTNWQTIQSIKTKGKEKVYDIEVEDTHCFFANNIMVHNCHHTSARTVKEVLSSSPNAYWRFGGSATPYREDGAEMMIQAMFGKKIVDVSASYLIEKGYLVPPSIIFEPIAQDCNLHAWRSVYKHCVIDNEAFNRHIAATANYLVSKGLSVLVLVTQYAQGNFLKELIPDTPFVTGKKSNKQRIKAIDDFRSRKHMCLIATTLADEGLDIPTLDAVLMAGGGASATRVNQRIGRTLRKDRKAKKQKKKALAIYYNHKGVKHLGGHAKKAKKILKLEPKFEILDSAGEDYLFSEIDQIMGFDTQPYGPLFDL